MKDEKETKELPPMHRPEMRDGVLRLRFYQGLWCLARA